MPPLCAFAGLLLGSLGSAPASQAARPQESADDGTRFFALPMVRDTRELSAVAEEHLRAGRFPEALQALQRILEEHAHEVLSPERAGTESRSTYPGAAEWALARLFELPPAARAEYRARYEPRAAAALEHALREPGRAPLAAVPRQWPLTRAAVRAWWALGDLELESGQLGAAQLAWRRAQELAAEVELESALEEPAAGGMRARLEWLRARAERARARLPGIALPRGDALPWSTPLDMSPFAQRGSPTIGRNLLPISSDDMVLVGTTLRLYALDAFTGELRWKAGPPSGWGALAPGADARLFEGINYEQLLLSPAVADGVALAVLQEAFTENENEEWQGIPIMTAIPERRLHAFALADGRELWNHAPELSFDGLRQHWDGSGAYAQRMMVAGSPTVVDGRVLVPCYRMQGRIDYHVACYELASGELLWSTQVISGQRERNMFGRSVYEFSSSPLVVLDGRVLAQTELGTLAALDLFSGRIQWQTTYRQIALPKTRSYHPPKRQLTWTRLAAPVVVGDLLVAAPSDSNEIVALRLADGAKLWEYSEESLQGLDRETEPLGFSLLVGADADTLYLSGAKLSALQKPGGLASSAPFVPRWTHRLDRPDTSPRAVLAGEVVLAPSPLERVAFERRSGERVQALSGSWNRGEPGNVWLEEGALFSLSNQGISGYFDWQAQLERARRLAGPQASEGELQAAAELFLRRGRLAFAEGGLETARTTLSEAGALFARLRARSVRPDVRAELACARELAEVLARLLREEEALAVLSAARKLAASPAELALLLFQEERIRRARGGAPRIALLDALESCWGDQPLPAEQRTEAARLWLGENDPTATLQSDELPTSLWVGIERAGERERAGELGPALEDLHSALAHARGRLLARGYPVAGVVRERIARLLALPRGREAYAPIAARAAALLAEARTSADPARTEALVELYPHSRAADTAVGLLLERALAERDARGVAALVRAALARGGLSRERETDLLLALGRALGQEGNAAFERDLVALLARSEPARVSPLPAHRGLSLAALAAELGRESLEPAPAPVLFAADVVSDGKPRALAAEYLGALRAARAVQESAPLELHVYATKTELVAHASNAPGQPLWRHPLDQPLEGGRASCAFAPGRFVYATRAALVCLDEQGRERWTRASADDPVRALAEAGGVLVARLRSGTVLACDSLYGLALWEKTLGGEDWTGPLAGEAHAVFFSQAHAQAPRALVLDLFRGRVSADIRLNGFDSRSALEETAWIAEERLIAPSFFLRPAQLSAFALEGGKRAWTIEFGRDEEFHALAHSEGRAYPITLAAALDSAAGNGGVYELDERIGSVRRVLPLKPGERIMGLETGQAATLAAPYLFTFTYSESERSVPVRSIHLQSGIQWKWSLPITSQEIYDGRSLPMPAVSDECVAIAYQTRRAQTGQGGEATIVFVDKRAGTKVDTLILGGNFAQSSRLELRGLGAALFVLGKGSPPRGAGFEILESHR